MSRSIFLQEAVDKQIADIASKPLNWICELPMYSDYKFVYAGEEFLGVLQFLVKAHERKNNSLMLSISIEIEPLVYRRYSSGFLFDEDKVIQFITDELKLWIDLNRNGVHNHLPTF